MFFFFSARKMLFQDDRTFSYTSSSDLEGWLSFVTNVMQSSKLHVFTVDDFEIIIGGITVNFPMPTFL